MGLEGVSQTSGRGMSSTELLEESPGRKEESNSLRG
jgi:hypothetical protein